jgi:hypothetical protein
MSRLKYLKDMSLKELSFERIMNAVKVRLKDIPHFIAWHTNTSFAKQNKAMLAKYHNKHKGQRCFIVANGPSLKKTDLTKLKDEVTIGMNRMYMNAGEMGFMPTYIVVQDIAIQLVQFRDDLDALDHLPKFFNWNARSLFTKKDNLAFIRSDYSPQFSTDLTKTTWGGHSVTAVCMQLAFYMGFDEVYLVGKDHNYEQTGTPGALVYSTGDEKNHFVQGYYKKGMAWRIPDYKGEELAYRMARETFEKHGRIVKDATIDGKLDVFEKVNYNSLFNK